MTTVFHAKLFGRFKKTKNNLRRKILYSTNHGSNFLEDKFSNKDKVDQIEDKKPVLVVATNQLPAHT